MRSAMNWFRGMLDARVRVVVGACALLGGVAAVRAELVAKWDFSNFDSANPTSANVLQAAVGGQAGVPCTSASNKTSVETTDGTLGPISVVSAPELNLPAGKNALAIPKRAHVKLPLPEGRLVNRPWTIRMVFRAPAESAGSWRSLFNWTGNTSDGRLFLNLSNNLGGGLFQPNAGWQGSYGTEVSRDAWHTLVITTGPVRSDVFLDGNAVISNPSLSLTTLFNNATSFLLSADEDGEDNLLYFSSVEIWDEGAAPEACLPGRGRCGLTGEWTFPADNLCQASVGRDLEQVTRTDSATLSALQSGCVLPGDSAARTLLGSGFKCYHGLQPKSSYTVVMDIRVPSGVEEGGYHTLFQPRPQNDGDGAYALFGNGESMKFWVASSTFATGTVSKGEWHRFVVTFNHATRVKTAYFDGETYDTRVQDIMQVLGDCFWFAYDNDWDDRALDLSYAAIYDRVLSEAEVRNFHARPTAHTTAGDTLPTVAPAGVWERSGDAFTAVKNADLAVSDGVLTWTRSDVAPAHATWVFDLTVPAVQDAGGALVANPSTGTASGFFGTSAGTYSGLFATQEGSSFAAAPATAPGWGLFTYNPVSRGEAHRVAVTWTSEGRVSYAVDGKMQVQKDPLVASSRARPSQTMAFLDGLAAAATRIEAYDEPLTPFELEALGGAGAAPNPSANIPEVTLSVSVPTPFQSILDEAVFTVSCTDVDGDWATFQIDYGDGAIDVTTRPVAPGVPVTFRHVYRRDGTFTPVVRAYSLDGRVSASVAGTPVAPAASTKPARDVLLTWPWLQNVYTNRFTVMCETREVWPGLQLQWGADYANQVEMSYVQAANGTYVYKANVTVEDSAGTEIPYRVGFSGLGLTGSGTELAEATVRLWPMDDSDFTCSVWGDNQQGAATGDWDADRYLYIRRMFEHMLAQKVDFGLSTGDMASSANYETQIRPGILDSTDAIFGRVLPYYVAWGNHDTSAPEDKTFFENVSANDPDYQSSLCGNGYLYRGNVLFVFIDHQLQSAAETKTWLANLLATERARGAKFRVLLQHYPIYGEVWGSLCQTLLPTAVAGGVDLVLSGHMHGYERIEKDGFVQIVNGGAGYLDHNESVVNNYGDATKVGGHRPVPYLWARQADRNTQGVLGGSEPVRTGCITSYGELSVSGNTLTWRAHGFNADGSYIGVFDTRMLVSKTVAAPESADDAGTGAVCADPASFATFTNRPVTNAKWKEYADAVGKSFAVPEDGADDPVTGISKTEIKAFLKWLNGTTGDYRLPTVDELAAAREGKLAGAVTEWTSTVDPVDGFCRILGGNAQAQAGTWCRTADRPAIATPDCSASYLGFRLARGAAPAMEDPLAGPLAALAGIAEPATAYLWRQGLLVDISAEWAAPTGPLAYTDPVLLPGGGDLVQTTAYDVTLAGGLLAPNATSFTKAGAGMLTLGGSVRGGPVTTYAGWRLASEGGLTLADASYIGSTVRFDSGDGLVRLQGSNDLGSAAIVVETGSATNFVAATAASLYAKSLRDYTSRLPLTVGARVTLTLAEDLKIRQTDLRVDGLLDVAGVNVTANEDPWYLGSGTIRTGYFGAFENSWQRLAVSNVVLTSSHPVRSNKLKSVNRMEIAGAGVRIASTVDWTVPARDELGGSCEWLHNLAFVANPSLVVDTCDPDDGATVHAATWTPARVGEKLAIVKAGEGTLTLRGAYATAVTNEVRGGTLYLDEASCPSATFRVGAEGTLEMVGTGVVARACFEGGCFRPADGASPRGVFEGPMVVQQAEGAEMVLDSGAGTVLAGPLSRAADTACIRLKYLLGASSEGEYLLLAAPGIGLEEVAVTTDADASRYENQLFFRGNGDLMLRLLERGAEIAVWTGRGDRTNPFDPDNWEVTDGSGNVVEDAVPGDTTRILLSGETSLNVPAGRGFVYGTLILGDQVTLTSDCDWTGLGSVRLRNGSVLDLHGHVLTLNGFEATADENIEITDTTTDADAPGVLRLQLGEGLELANQNVHLTGNLRLVKQGSGLYAAAASCSYTGGTRIEGGTFRVGGSLYQTRCGSHGSTIAVGAGATFDMYTYRGGQNYRFQLEGGTLTGSQRPGEKDLSYDLGNLSLTADSQILLGLAESACTNNDIYVSSGSTWNLGGHTLRIFFQGPDPDMWIFGLKIQNGTVKTEGHGWFQDRGIDGSENGSLDLDSDYLRNGSASVVQNLRARATISTIWPGVDIAYGCTEVRGVFTPRSPYCFNVRMADGSTIDLREQTGTWSTTFTNTIGTPNGLVTFADNARVYLELTGRLLPSRQRIVAWETPPANLATLTFTASCGIVVKSDGIYPATGTTIILR